MRKSTIKNLKDKVWCLLRDHPKARDSDQWATIKLWTILFPHLIDYTDPKNPKIALKDIMNMPREDNVKRVRAIIQNVDGEFLPTSEEVAKQRKINMDVWRSYTNGLNLHYEQEENTIQS